MSKSDDQQDSPAGQINIELPEEIAEGTYANLVMIAHSAEEFIMDFIRIMPGMPKANVKSRIIVTPPHAKRLLRALADNITRYEMVHGEIDEHVAPGQPVQFGFPGGEA